MLNKLKIIFFSSLICISITASAKIILDKDAVANLEKVNYKTVKGRYHLYTYYQQAVTLLKEHNDKQLLSTIIKSYVKEFHYNQNHFNLEPFIPYYKKNKNTVSILIKKIATKKEAIDFFRKIELAEQEFTEGNG